jgi:hypothetical protein
MFGKKSSEDTLRWRRLALIALASILLLSFSFSGLA